MATLARYAGALERATPANNRDASLLGELDQMLRGEKLLGVSQAAKLLGVSSPQTVRNYIERGLFPEAGRTAGGHRQIRLSDVIAAQKRIAEVRASNATGMVEIRDFGDEDPYAGR